MNRRTHRWSILAGSRSRFDPDRFELWICTRTAEGLVYGRRSAAGPVKVVVADVDSILALVRAAADRGRLHIGLVDAFSGAVDQDIHHGRALEILCAQNVQTGPIGRKRKANDPGIKHVA